MAVALDSEVLMEGHFRKQTEESGKSFRRRARWRSSLTKKAIRCPNADSSHTAPSSLSTPPPTSPHSVCTNPPLCVLVIHSIACYVRLVQQFMVFDPQTCVFVVLNPSQNRHKYQPTVVNCIEHCVVHRTVSNVIKLNRISDMMTYSGCGNVDWVQPLWVCLAQSVRC